MSGRVVKRRYVGQIATVPAVDAHRTVGSAFCEHATSVDCLFDGLFVRFPNSYSGARSEVVGGVSGDMPVRRLCRIIGRILNFRRVLCVLSLGEEPHTVE